MLRTANVDSAKIKLYRIMRSGLLIPSQFFDQFIEILLVCGNYDGFDAAGDFGVVEGLGP